MKNSTFLKPIPALLTGAFIISFSSVLVQISNVPSFVSAFYRVLFGSIFLIIACAIKKEFKKRSLRNNLLAVLCGLLFALDLGTWHMSIKYVGPGLATILGNFQVFGLTFAGYFLLKERLGWKFLISVPIAFFGLFLIIGVDNSQLSSNYLIGVFLGLSTAFFYCLFLLLLRKLQSLEEQFSIFYYLMILSISSAFFLGITALLSGDQFIIPDTKSLISLVTLGLFIQTLAWMLITNSLPKIKASLAGLILLLQPSLSFIWDCIFFNRSTGTAGWIGVTIVIVAIYFGVSDKETKQ